MKIIENGQGRNPVNCLVSGEEIDSVQPHFDGVGCLVRSKLSNQDENFLQKHSYKFATARLKWGYLLKLSIPDIAAIRLLDRLGTIYYVEPALGIVLKSEDLLNKWSRLLGEETFVQRWHGKRHCWKVEETNYSANRSSRQRHNFIRYPGISKITGEINHIKIEGRYQGLEACRSIGVERPRDLIKFNHRAYWERYLTIFNVDFEQLGRSHENRKNGQKRRTTQVIDFTGFNYNVDKSRGGRLYQWFSLDQETGQRSLQTFVDKFGRGPWLHRLDVREILDLISDQEFNIQTRKILRRGNGFLRYEHSVAYI